MCWLTVLQGGLGIASQVMAQNAAAENQNAQYQQNALNANQSASEQYAQNYLRQIQEEARATQERIATGIELAKARGTAVASSENSGSSMFSTIHDIERQGARDVNVTDINLRNTVTRIAADNNSTALENKGRIDSVSQASGADPVATAISGLGVVVGIAGNNKLTGTDAAEIKTAPAAKSFDSANKATGTYRAKTEGY